MYIDTFKAEIGKFRVDTGKLVVSDPGYDLDTIWNQELEVKKGEYTAHILYGEVPSWGERVLEISINHSTCPKKKAVKRIARCAVDSGQCGFFEAENYKQFHPEHQFTKQSEAWYWRACRVTDSIKNHKSGIMRSMKKAVGALSESGLGDGCYWLYAGYDNRGQITALRLRFI